MPAPPVGGATMLVDACGESGAIIAVAGIIEITSDPETRDAG